MKKKLKELKKGDIIAIVFGFDYLKAIVVGNNGTCIIWYSVNWTRSSAKISSYGKMESMKWSFIGYLVPSFIFFKKIKYLNPPKINPLTISR